MELTIVYPLKWFPYVHGEITDDYTYNLCCKMFNKALKLLTPEVYRECPDIMIKVYGSLMLNSLDMIIIFDFMGRMHYITQSDVE